MFPALHPPPSHSWWTEKRGPAIDTDAEEEQLATLLKLTERYCVVYQTLATTPALSTTLATA